MGDALQVAAVASTFAYPAEWPQLLAPSRTHPEPPKAVVLALGVQEVTVQP